MKNVSTFLTLITVTLTLPGVAMAGGTCDQLCSATKDSVKALIANQECKASATCTDCVANSVLGSQSGAQCQAYTSTKKSSTKQVISTSLYAVTGIACGIGCALTMIPGYGSSQIQTMTNICGGLGLATAVTDIGFALTSNDIAGGLMSSIGGIGTISKSAGMMTAKAATLTTDITKDVAGVATKTGTKATKQAKTNVCLNAAIYLGTAVMKGISLKKLNANKDQGCSNVESLASLSNSPVQSCLASAGTGTKVNSTAMASLFTATPETFPSVTSDDVNRQEAVAGAAGDMMKSMKSDLDAATAAGAIDMNDIAKRLDKGEDVSSIAASAGLPSQITDPLKEFEAKAKAGETSALLASLSGGTGYSSAGTGAVAGGSPGMGDLSFGSAATPGEGGDTINIDRKPAGAAASASLTDGDVFHGSYSGTIFDIVTYRLKAQKSDYAELDPEGRMNRLFNGYGEPGSKSTRKPATTAHDKSAK